MRENRGAHTFFGTEARRSWLERLVDGVVNEKCDAVLGPDGLEYTVKCFLREYLKPGEWVRFVPSKKKYAGQPWASEVHRLRRQPKTPPF